MSLKSSSLLAPGPLALTALILLAALSRLLPHPFNFSPIEAVALFGGAHFVRRGWALAVPLLAMLVSDLALALINGGIYLDYFLTAGFALVYLCIALSTALGFRLQGRVGAGRVAAYSVLGSILFFIVTNFGAWLGSPMYPQTASGLAAAYVAGLPFFQNTLLGTLFYSAVLFGSFAWMRGRIPALRAQTA
jgi:hypothetical protein